MSNELKEVLDALEDVIYQACYDRETNKLDSMFISGYACGIRTLAKYGRCKIVSDGGRGVLAVLEKK